MLLYFRLEAIDVYAYVCGCLQANSRYLSCIATCCFYIAAKTQESPLVLPSASELIKLSQCGGSEQDLINMERCIIDKLDGQYNGVTPLSFLKLFYQLIVDQDDETLYNSLVSSLEVIMCHHEFIKYRVSTSSYRCTFKLVVCSCIFSLEKKCTCSYFLSCLYFSDGDHSFGPSQLSASGIGLSG